MTQPTRSQKESALEIPTDIVPLGNLVRVLGLRYFRFIIFLSLISGAFAFVQAQFFSPRRFKSTAVIMPRSRGSADILSNKAASVISALSTSVSSATQDVQQLTALLKSKRLAASAFEIASKRAGEMGIPIKKSTLSFDMAASGLIFTVNAVGPSADLAFEYLTAYLQALQRQMSENQSSQSQRAVDFINARLQEVKTNLDELETRLTKIRVGERPSGSDGTKSLEIQLAHAKREYQIQSTVLETLSQQKEIAQIDSKRDEQMFVIIDPPLKNEKPFMPVPRVSATYGLMVGALISLFLILVFYRMGRLGILSIFDSKARR